MKASGYLYKPFYIQDVYFDYLIGKGSEPFIRANKEAAVFLVYSGQLVISYKNEKILIKKGEYGFVNRDVIVSLKRKNCEGEQFCCVFMSFGEKCLLDFYNNLDESAFPFTSSRFNQCIIKLPYSPYLQSLYISLKPYLDWGIKPCADILRLKRIEGIYSLLLTDSRFYPCLFDFIYMQDIISQPVNVKFYRN